MRRAFDADVAQPPALRRAEVRPRRVRVVVVVFAAGDLEEGAGGEVGVGFGGGGTVVVEVPDVEEEPAVDVGGGEEGGDGGGV